MRPQLPPAQLGLILYELWLGASLLTKIRRNHTALDAAKKMTEQLLNINHKET
jgi:TetR/AcrR family transcriptional repressor of nem operon